MPPPGWCGGPLRCGGSPDAETLALTPRCRVRYGDHLVFPCRLAADGACSQAARPLSCPFLMSASGPTRTFPWTSAYVGCLRASGLVMLAARFSESDPERKWHTIRV